MKYRGVLTASEVINFSKLLYDIQSARFTKMEVTPDERHVNFIVKLESFGSGESFLPNSLESQLLHEYGWDKKFNEIKE